MGHGDMPAVETKSLQGGGAKRGGYIEIGTTRKVEVYDIRRRLRKKNSMKWRNGRQKCPMIALGSHSGGFEAEEDDEEGVPNKISKCTL